MLHKGDAAHKSTWPDGKWSCFVPPMLCYLINTNLWKKEVAFLSKVTVALIKPVWTIGTQRRWGVIEPLLTAHCGQELFSKVGKSTETPAWLKLLSLLLDDKLPSWDAACRSGGQRVVKATRQETPAALGTRGDTSVIVAVPKNSALCLSVALTQWLRRMLRERNHLEAHRWKPRHWSGQKPVQLEKCPLRSTPRCWSSNPLVSP